MRVISEELYGVRPERVIGSAGDYEVKLEAGKLDIVKAPKIAHVNDKEGKVAGILTQIGRVPVLAAGNERSGGDIAMLTYTQSSPYPSLQLLINHDDAEREVAYSETDNASLAAAKANGWHVVSIKDDWHTVYPAP